MFSVPAMTFGGVLIMWLRTVEDELTYVLDMINMVIRPQLFRLLEWKIGIQTDFKVSVGKSGKYMNRWLSKELYQRYLDTYSHADKEAIWKSVFIMCTWWMNWKQSWRGIWAMSIIAKKRITAGHT
jgi:hypothetical protein